METKYAGYTGKVMAARGWDKNGIPTEATLRRLKIK